MFRHQLVVSLSLLLGLVLVQAWLTFWSFQNLTYHKERSLSAQQMLTDVVQFRADAKRLKVWLADFIITEKSNTQVRDNLFQRMEQHLNQLRIQNRLFEQSIRHQDQLFSQAVNQNTLLLTQNLNALKQALQTREVQALDSDEARWQTLLALFDKFQGADIQQVVNELIELHKAHVIQAEADADATRQFIYIVLLSVTPFSLALMIFLSYLLLHRFNQAMRDLSSGAKRFAQGQLSEAIPAKGPQEFQDLARRFNGMAQHLDQAIQTQIQLQETTEEKVRERTAQLQHVVTQLHDAEQRQQGFLAELTHELRTPTTLILGEAELALRHTNSPNHQQTLTRIIDSCQSLSSRIDDLIMVSRGQHALVSVALKPVSLADFYQALVKQCQDYQARLDFALTLTAPEQADKYQLYIDLEKMHLVFGILLENALHYQLDPLQVSLSMHLQPQTLSLVLADQGIGIDDTKMAQLFTRYSRGEQAKKMRPEGLGLGLPIAKTLVEAQDGVLHLAHNSPQGTKAIIDLPLFEVIDTEQ